MPETDWYVDTIRRSMPAVSRIGLSTTISCIVEQFGFAIRPLCCSSTCGLTSLTTSGMSSSRRKRDELSTTTQPASTNRRAHSPDVVAPALNSAMSKPWIVSSFNGWTVPTPSSSRPAERSDANGTSSRAGKPRSRSFWSITVPTAPVAPTTATR